MGKGAASGGAHGSSRVEYPPYLVNLHSMALYGYDLSGTNTNVYGKEPTPNSIYGAIQKITGGFGDSSFSGFSTTASGSNAMSDGRTPIMQLIDDIDRKVGGRFTIPDPSTYFSSVQTKITEYNNLVDALDTSADIDTYIIDIETDTQASHQRAVNDFAAHMADVGAETSSAFLIGLATLASERSNAILDARAKVAMQDRSTKLEAKKQQISIEFDYQKASLLAELDHINQYIQYYIISQTWRIKSYQMAGNLLASVAGAVSVPNHNARDSSVGSMLGLLGIGAGLAGLIFPGFWPSVGKSMGSFFGATATTASVANTVKNGTAAWKSQELITPIVTQ